MKTRMTKIICTLGPATDDIAVMRSLVRAGIDTARFNFSHGTHEEQGKRLETFRRACTEEGRQVPVLLDTKGPEIRLGVMKSPVTLKAGQKYILTTEEVEGDEKRASVSYKGIMSDIREGDRILIDDGLVELRIRQLAGTDIVCDVLNEGQISSRKGVNLPGIEVNLPSMTEQDIKDILFGIQMDFDFVAVSFVRGAPDIVAVRRLLDKNGGRGINIVAKIENKQGVDNIEEIISVADGVMVARGDLGVEIPLERIPIVQRKLIETCFRRGKPAITATQMLDSMMRNPRPTRAEVNDVAQAIFEGTSAIMLSGETASGKYPLETLKMMDGIARATEESIDYKERFRALRFDMPQSITNAISHATCTTALSLDASAIITVSKSGRTARMISRFRPPCPIIASSPNEKVCRQLNISWGVIPKHSQEVSTTDDLFKTAEQNALDTGILQEGDLVVITAGVPVGLSGTTNLIKAQILGDVLIRGLGVGSGEVTAPLCVAKTASAAAAAFSDGDIIVLPDTGAECLSLLRRASALIVETDNVAGHAATSAQVLDIPVILRAHGATDMLKNGMMVKVDPIRGLVSLVN